MPLSRILAAVATSALLLAAAPAFAASDFAKAERRCTETARERGLTVNGVTSLREVSSREVEVVLSIPRAPDVRCRWDERRDRVSFPDGIGTVRPPKPAENKSPREACEDLANENDIRIGRYESTRKLPANRYEVRFDRPLLFGERHKCFYDAQRRIASFEGEGGSSGGGAVPLPQPVEDPETRARAEAMCLGIARAGGSIDASVKETRWHGGYVEVSVVFTTDPGEPPKTCRYDVRRRGAMFVK